MDTQRYKYLFGPVPSRRLGRSLGVDIVPLKTCTQNCIYCQLGKDVPQTLDRRDYVPIQAVLDELRRKIQDGLDADYITISGSGEPTLHAHLGTLIGGIRQLTTIPVAIITNGSLLICPDVRRDCAKADVVLPSLDAGDPTTFEKMNQPHAGLTFDSLVEGLCRFREEYQGKIWLECFFCEGVNTDSQSLQKIKKQILRINPDKVQLNTSVRPTAHIEALRVSPEKLEAIAHELGNSAEVITDFSKHIEPQQFKSDKAVILDLLRRRPCTIEDIYDGLGLNPNTARKLIRELLKTSEIIAEEKKQKKYYKIR